MSQEDKKKRLKETLNLPRTDFAMKANLPQNEPARLAVWEAMGLYGQIREARKGAPKYILHDGPPYANGAIHLGHALNKCIKDFVVKTKTMAGFDAPYVPGWDCHGLPIEIKVDEQLGGKKLEMDPVAVRKACREYAGKFLDLQRSQFKRLGVFGRWDKPYATMDFPYEASILETFYGFYEKGFVYKGLKPVYWCTHDHTALAEAEVEYAMHTSPSVYVRYRLTSDAGAKIACLKGIGAGGQDPGLDDHLDDNAVDAAGERGGGVRAGSGVCGAGGRRRCVYRCGGAGESRCAGLVALIGDLKSANGGCWEFPGSKLDRVTFAHPFLDREVSSELTRIM